MSTERRDQLAQDLANGLIVYGAGNADEYRADAQRSVDGVIAEALRNAAGRLDALAQDRTGIGATHDIPGLLWAANTLRADAAALERGAFESLSAPAFRHQDHVQTDQTSENKTETERTEDR